LIVIHAKFLVDISAISELPNLEKLDLSYTPKVDFSKFPYLPKLTRLLLTIGKLKSLNFMKALPLLNVFVTNAAIEDANLLPLSGKKWEHLFVRHKKNYNARIGDFM
jgi:Leucine-rich repeat (LRR) protein